MNCPYLFKEPQIKLILSPVKNEKIINSYKKLFPNKLFDSLKGHFINKKIFKDYNLKKKYDILIYGSRSGRLEIFDDLITDKEYKEKWERNNNKKISENYYIYPLRVRIENLLLKNKEKYILNILPEKGSLKYHKLKYYNESLSHLINQSWITIASCCRGDKLMDKYLEISASNSCILGNIPSDYKNVFENNIIDVTEWMSDKEILDKIDNFLSNKKKLKEMSLRLKNIVDNEYNLKEGVLNIDKIIDKHFKA